jgi:hypothetical protein
MACGSVCELSSRTVATAWARRASQFWLLLSGLCAPSVIVPVSMSLYPIARSFEFPIRGWCAAMVGVGLLLWFLCLGS